MDRLRIRPALLIAAVLLLPMLLHAQREHDPLTADQEDQVRDVADQPNERVKLFIKFIEQRTDSIHHTVLRPATQHPGADIHQQMIDFTSLVDELQDNLDEYDDTHQDVRKSLKYLLERTPRWSDALREPPSSPQYNFERTTALDAVNTLNGAAKDLLASQGEYFGRHKNEKAPKKDDE